MSTHPDHKNASSFPIVRKLVVFHPNSEIPTFDLVAVRDYLQSKGVDVSAINEYLTAFVEEN